MITCKVKLKKWSRSESEFEMSDEYVVIDPKPSDLSMSRVKVR